jgi:hypothetical protein
MEDVHRESLEDEATHATDEARMVLPGVQALLGFQLIAVFNQRFTELGGHKQLLHLAAFLLIALATGLIMRRPRTIGRPSAAASRAALSTSRRHC